VVVGGPIDGYPVGGVIGMDDHVSVTKPGTGLPVTNGAVQPVQVPHLDDATVALLWRNMLIGGMPGSGKANPLRTLAVHAALAPERDATSVGVPRHVREGLTCLRS